MNLVTSKINTGKAVNFEDIIKKYQEDKGTVKTAASEVVVKEAAKKEEINEVSVKTVEKVAEIVEEEKKEEECKCEDLVGEKKEECEEEQSKAANKAPQFVKIANLDAKNKKFLTDYWRQIFGDDYVNALVADK